MSADGSRLRFLAFAFLAALATSCGQPTTSPTATAADPVRQPAPLATAEAAGGVFGRIPAIVDRVQPSVAIALLQRYNLVVEVTWKPAPT